MQRHGSLAMVSPCCSSSRQITHSPASLANTSSEVAGTCTRAHTHTYTRRAERISVCTKDSNNFRLQQHIKHSRQQLGGQVGALHRVDKVVVSACTNENALAGVEMNLEP